MEPGEEPPVAGEDRSVALTSPYGDGVDGEARVSFGALTRHAGGRLGTPALVVAAVAYLEPFVAAYGSWQQIESLDRDSKALFVG